MKRIQFMHPLFYERLNQLLKEKKLSAKRLSKEMGVSINTAYDWINDMRIMTTVNFFELCKFLDVSPLWLYGISNDRLSFQEAAG